MKIFCNYDGTAALETAIVLPLFIVLTLGITDVGGSVFARMTINAASQAGVSYAVNYPTATLSDVETAIDQAAGDSSFCTTIGACSASLQSACAPAPAQCIVTVTARHSWTPILPIETYSWALPTGISYTITVRVL